MVVYEDSRFGVVSNTNVSTTKEKKTWATLTMGRSQWGMEVRAFGVQANGIS